MDVVSMGVMFIHNLLCTYEEGYQSFVGICPLSLFPLQIQNFHVKSLENTFLQHGQLTFYDPQSFFEHFMSSFGGNRFYNDKEDPHFIVYRATSQWPASFLFKKKFKKILKSLTQLAIEAMCEEGVDFGQVVFVTERLTLSTCVKEDNTLEIILSYQ